MFGSEGEIVARAMAPIVQRGPDEPANGWVFWAIVGILIAFVVLIVLSRVT